MTTSSFYGAFDQTICQSTTNRCRDVSILLISQDMHTWSWSILRVLYNEFMVVYNFPVARQVKELLMFTIIYKFAILLPKRNEKFPNLVVVYRFIYHMVEPLFCSLFYLCIINNTFLISNNSCSLDDCVNSWMNACTSFRIVQLWSHVCIFFPLHYCF